MPFETGYRVEECTANRDASGDEGKGNPAGARAWGWAGGTVGGGYKEVDLSWRLCLLA